MFIHPFTDAIQFLLIKTILIRFPFDDVQQMCMDKSMEHTLSRAKRCKEIKFSSRNYFKWKDTRERANETILFKRERE